MVAMRPVSLRAGLYNFTESFSLGFAGCWSEVFFARYFLPAQSLAYSLDLFGVFIQGDRSFRMIGNAESL